MSEGRRAILIGNAAYAADAKLPDLACPLNDVDGLAAVLADPALGGFAPVETLRDAPSAEIRKRTVVFLRSAEPGDTVLFYYSGHGKLDDGFNLYLCSSDSEVALLEATAVPIGFVQGLLKKCRAEKTVMLLDCCYSGAAGGMRARGNVDDTLKLAVRGSGTYLLTASDAIETAQEKEGSRYGVFTKHVIEGLSSGSADREGRGFVTMDDLYDYVVRAVRADSPQRPNREVGGHGDIVIARSGKDSPKDRARAAAKLLYARAAAGDLDPTIAAAAEAVARKRPSTHSPADAAIDAALGELLAEHITLGAFVTVYWQAQSLVAPPPCPAPEPPLRPEPAEAESGASKAQRPLDPPSGIANPFPAPPEIKRPVELKLVEPRPPSHGWTRPPGKLTWRAALTRLAAIPGRPVYCAFLTPGSTALVLLVYYFVSTGDLDQAPEPIDDAYPTFEGSADIRQHLFSRSTDVIVAVSMLAVFLVNFFTLRSKLNWYGFAWNLFHFYG